MALKRRLTNWHFEVLGSGTSQGVPVIGCPCPVCQSQDPRDNRLRSSFFVERENTRILIDAGPDLRQQLLRSGIHDLDAVIITHEHQDHTAGLDELRAINFLQKHAIPVFCSARVEDRLREQYSYIFKNADYPGIPQIELRTLPQESFQIGDLEIEPIHLMHWNLPVTGFRFGPLAYITDANQIPEREWSKLQGLEVLILNALRQEKHHSHFSLSEAVEIADKLKVPEFYATHVSHQMGLHESVEKKLAPGRKLAFDGLKLKLS